MKSADKLGALLKSQREILGLTQRALGGKIGVEASHIAFLETGRRRPSLKLVAHLADALDVDRHELFILAHPEAKGLFEPPAPQPPQKKTRSWLRFIRNSQLLARYHVTRRELQVLEQLSLLGSALSVKEFLAILTLLRDIPK
ncbi:MAG TPA: helix-turn-helix transcriptional regulator [Candidatus Binataceae bacterium]|nr:helix-turn-helix transcriptional regulator [Candidatus Binataceae bacterium]